MPWTFEVSTDKDTHFTTGLATGAEEQENLALPAALADVNGKARGRIKMITVLSDQNLAWELNFWKKDTFHTSTDADLVKYVGRWSFAEADGVQIAGAGFYLYHINGLDIPVEDEDLTGELHVSLVNRSAVAKNAGATGEIVVKFHIQPMYDAAS